MNRDTQLYHLQIIRWTNEFGTVPGIANLYPRLGLGSTWFNLISLFYIPAFKHQNFTFLNTTLSIWFILWLVERWNYFTYQKKRLPNSHIFSLLFFLLISYFVFDWQLLRDTANSTSYDFIITALSIFSIFFLLSQCFSKAKKPFSFLFILLSISVVSFKLSGLSILFLAFIYLLNYQQVIVWLKSFLAGCFILLPVLIKNHITTGYPVYPLAVSINSPEWQVPGEITLKFKNYILNANKFYNHQLTFIEAFDQGKGIKTFNWIPFWFKGILIRHKILFLFAALSLLLLIYTPLVIPRRKKFRLLLGSIWIIAITWFFSAPDPRFGFGFLLIMAFLPISVFFAKYFSPRLYTPSAYLSGLAILIYLYAKTSDIRQNTSLLLHTASIGSPLYTKIVRNGVSFYEVWPINDSTDKRCYFTPLPCLPEMNPYVIPRSNKLKDGFKMTITPDSSFIRNYNY
ncbi:MAG TPA: hypothetical protein VF487_05080 [Chitinophagaceae bacterium]